MKKPNITKGEWFIMPQHQEDKILVYADGGHELPTVCHVPMDYLTSPSGRTDIHPISAANAKAIAALPCLLSALEVLLDEAPVYGMESFVAAAQNALTLAGYEF